MKVTHPSGQDYDLYPDSEIEVTRFNPFFHEFGEQSVPVSIPATPKNLQLLGYPDRLDNINKSISRLDTTIQSGLYSIVGRQAILSAQRKASIETSFYFNEGAFYEKMSDLTLSEIFEEKKVEFASIDAAISFMHNLLTNDDPRFAVFEVATDNYQLNELEYYLGQYYFVKDGETEEVIDDVRVTVPKGFYITPFVKVKHVLEDVFSFMGYTLAPSFLDNPPFNYMVFLNDNLDTIVGNSINYVDLVPNVTVKKLLDVLRKFDIEFIPDEVNRIINIVPFDQGLQDAPSADLTSYAISVPIVNYHNEYKQVKLSSERLPLPSELSRIIYYSQSRGRRKIKTGTSNEDSLLLIEILSQYPTVYLRKVDGAIVRDGVRGDQIFTEKVSSLSMSYCAGGNLTVQPFPFSDVVPDMYVETSQSPGGSISSIYPYVGKGRALQSKIQFSNDAEGEDEGGSSTSGSQTSPEELRPMLCLYYRKSNRTNGTLYNYDNEGNRLWNFSLMWNGEDGIFEKFWRKRDALLRNALLEVRVDVRLSENLKLSIPSARRVSFDSQNYLISELKYSTKENSIGSCTLLSTKIQTPISEAKSAFEFFREKIYKWNIRRTYSVTGAPGNPLSYRFASEPVAFYPPDPTPQQYASGGRYYERKYTVEYGRTIQDNFNKIGDCEMDVWLEPVLV